MKMLKVSQCKKNFDFGPKAPWPQNLPAFSWGEELLCDFGAPEGKAVVDLKTPEAELSLVFADIHKNLSLAELSHILKAEILDETGFTLLLEKNALRASESLNDLLKKLNLTPAAFQNWTIDKKLGAKELFILKALVSVSEVDSLLKTFSERNPSRQVGIQILENAIELFLMGHNLATLITEGSCEEWCDSLEKTRHPMMTSRIKEKQMSLATLPWPKFMNAKVIQHQASLVSEVRLQFRNVGELKRNIEALQKVQAQIENQPENKI